jgi:RNA recognition motif-containing protein
VRYRDCAAGIFLFSSLDFRPASFGQACGNILPKVGEAASQKSFEGGLPVAKKLYVGNLSYDMTDNELQTMFEQFGQVQSVQIIMDRDTGRSKGFGFVEMSNPQEAQAAIDGLHGKEVNGRALTVNEARPREERGPRGGGFGGGRGGGGGGGRGGYGGGKRY